MRSRSQLRIGVWLLAIIAMIAAVGLFLWPSIQASAPRVTPANPVTLHARYWERERAILRKEMYRDPDPNHYWTRVNIRLADEFSPAELKAVQEINARESKRP